MRQAVCQTVDQFRAHPEADLDVIIDRLVADGVEEALADRLTDFVPLAYGRVVLAAMGVRVADTYMRMQADGRRSPPRKLSEEPVYADALAMAHCEAETGLDEDTLQAIGRWSAELCTVNKAINQGLDLDDIEGSEMLPPVFGATEYPRELLPPRKHKRWWQFWLENHR
jgi:hypothetical protein